MQSYYKDIEAVSKQLKTMSYADVLAEYDAASNELNEVNETFQQLAAAMKEASEKQQMSIIKIAVIADVLKDHNVSSIQKPEKKSEKKAEIQNPQKEEKPKNIPTDTYKEAMVYAHGRNKAYELMREEGYDI